MTESEPDLKSQLQAPVIPEHWSLYLRCTICFGYLREPHTLACGHTFCRRCLKRLAEIAKDDNPDVRLRHLNLTCPTCRQPFPGRPVLTDRINTSIVLKHLVELWKAECSLLASSSALAVRSICTQTDQSCLPFDVADVCRGRHVGTGGSDEDESEADLGDTLCEKTSQQDLHEEFSVRMRPLDLYCQAVMQRVSESTEDLEHDWLQDLVFSPKGSNTTNTPNDVLNHPLATLGARESQQQRRQHHVGRGSDSSTDSDASSMSTASRRAVAGRRAERTARGSDNEQESSSLSSVSMPDLLGRVGFLPVLCDVGPARLLLLLAWCSYSVLIVGLVQSFLPYVMLFTLFFFLVLMR